MVTIPKPALERLTRLYTILSRLAGTETEKSRLSSKTLGELLGEEPHTIRKDLSILKLLGHPQKGGSSEDAFGDGGSQESDFENLLAAIGTERGYDREKLKAVLRTGLGLDIHRPACLVGLGRLGSAILHRMVTAGDRYDLVAAFDASVNRLELLQTSVPLYHSREIVRIVKEKRIELGVIAVPEAAAQDTVNRLISGGIRGVVNFAPVVLSPENSAVLIRNVSLAGELHALSAHLFLQGD